MAYREIRTLNGYKAGFCDALLRMEDGRLRAMHLGMIGYTIRLNTGAFGNVYNTRDKGRSYAVLVFNRLTSDHLRG